MHLADLRTLGNHILQLPSKYLANIYLTQHETNPLGSGTTTFNECTPVRQNSGAGMLDDGLEQAACILIWRVSPRVCHAMFSAVLLPEFWVQQLCQGLLCGGRRQLQHRFNGYLLACSSTKRISRLRAFSPLGGEQPS